MQTSLEVEGRLTPPQPLAAANEEFARQPQQPSSPAAAGWDPFEVWRTRVMGAQEKEATKSGAQIA